MSAALHLQARGRSVALIDRRGAGEETSFGNAGLIERSSVIPYAFPRDLGMLIRVGLGSATAARYQRSFLPVIAPWLLRYWRNSAPGPLLKAAQDMLPLIERSVTEHVALMDAAGARSLVRDTGWIEVHRSEASWIAAQAKLAGLAPYKLNYDVLQHNELRAVEPALRDSVIGGIHWRDPLAVSDPGALTKAYADLFARRGGRCLRGDARTLTADGDAWTVASEGGPVRAREVIVALGPWSSNVYAPLGYRIPLAVKRGYHMHYAPVEGAAPVHAMIDPAAGFALAPMAGGIRLTTGAEFARFESPATPVQLAKDEIIARQIIPLGARRDPEPWLGNRPCLPDMRPVIGPAARHRGLWFLFGHAHHGLTLGPATGRLLAEMMTGEQPFTDPAPYRPDRF